MTSAAVRFFVPGVPAPQGSKRAFVVGGHAVMAESSAARHKAWRTAVAQVAIDRAASAVAAHGQDGPSSPARVRIEFVMPRPKSRKRDTWVATRPDVDKLVRSTLDGLTDSGLISDDALVVEIHAVKRYAAPNEPTGALISVEWIR